jgi:sensor histidine kinase YesM
VKAIDGKHIIRTVSYTLVFNTVIALFLTAMKFGGDISQNFIVAQCIGLSICSCILCVHPLLDRSGPLTQLIAIIIAMGVGSVAGGLFGALALRINPLIFFQKYGLFKVIILGILFGSVISYFFYSREKISAGEALLQEERIKRLLVEKKAAETDLRLLQAQVEPHFLFNTLSNILSALQTDGRAAEAMLLDLTRYLRTSLSRSRQETTTIGQEMDAVRAYLNIFKARMGERLHFNIDIADSAESTLFPPMLIQPLVENAIKHGLEPKVEGGEITIRAEEKGGVLRVEITDTGIGFQGETASGIGLSNVRERLHTLYGNGARLTLEENHPSGVKAVIEAPK